MGQILQKHGQPLSPENIHHLILYDAPASPCSRRCRITLLEKGLEWDTVNLNLAHMEQRTPDYLSINPNGYVPTLAHGENLVFESGVINTYLEGQFPQPALMPKTAAGIAQVRKWQAAELAMARIFRPVMYALTAGPLKRVTRTEEESELISRLATDDPYDLAWERKVYRLEVLSQPEIEQHLQWLMEWVVPIEQALAGKDYLVEDEFSQADIAVYPRLEMYAGLGLQVSADRFPNVHRWMSRLEKRPSFVHSLDLHARKYLQMTQSPEMQFLRQYFATPESQRTPEMDTRVREFGASRRKLLGVDDLLANPGKIRALPRPLALQPAPSDPSVSEVTPGPDSALTLFGNSLSPHSQRIRLLLDFLQQDYTWHEVDLAKRENRSADFLALNPLGEVPVLRIEAAEPTTAVISDSSAIAEYLCNSIPGGKTLLPARNFELAKHHMWLALESGTLKEFSPLLAEVIYASQPGTGSRMDDNQRAYFTRRIAEKLRLLELQLESSAFLMGGQMMYCDLAWFSRCNAMQKTSMASEFAAFPAIQQWRQRVAQQLGLDPLKSSQ